jgi:hypothetical protein
LKSRIAAVVLCFAGAIYSQESIEADPQQAPAAAADPAAPAPKAPVVHSKKLEELPELPDFHVRAKELGHQLIGVQAFFEVIPGTISDHARNFPKEWTRSFEGLGKRFSSQYGQFLVSETVEFGVSALHHEDPRYYRMPNGTVKQRVFHSIASAFVAQKADGTGSTIALSRFAGVYGSWWVAQHWEPNSATGVGQFMLWGTVGMFTKTFANTFHEFWPDAKRKFFTHNKVD